MIADTVKVILPAVLTFIIGMLFTPIWANFLYSRKMWKPVSVKKTLDGHDATISGKLHDDENKKTPRMGGVIIWGSVLIVSLILWVVSFFIGDMAFAKIGFISRDQTWLVLFTLISTALVGLVDDYLVCRGSMHHIGGGLSLRWRLVAVALIGLVGAWWFYDKLDMASLTIPFFGSVELGILYPIVFILFTIGIYSGGIIDGVDGLAGGIFAIIFSSYAILAFINHQLNIAAFCMAVVGGLLVFLWFNIPPARFYLSETGTMALTTTIVVIAFLTEEVVALLVIAFPLIATSASSVIQILSKKFRGKKVFVVAPLHNHFQAIGWSGAKVTMRYWVVSMVFALFGIILGLISI